ncbi:hypothetical protein B0T24DRAFT_681422 [Lasiosphaeria ovina]|uniref:Berberine/berberine-like domain-containing protein n=1 Tax=Lasiosphaeria ovina TaxID=92902 RepID=A0AAE0K4W6_9PEZI|nr:hypothetical protein B0T24DRAFT_681422 [Lasiosphaeria ovina]
MHAGYTFTASRATPLRKSPATWATRRPPTPSGGAPTCTPTSLTTASWDLRGSPQSDYDRFNKTMAHICEVTPSGGAYYNEANMLEPNWQGTFYGSNYAKLLVTKRAREPWGVVTPG